MRTHVPNGLDVVYNNGDTEHIDCSHYWVYNEILHTETLSVSGHPVSKGPSFPLASIRKYQATP